MNHGRRASGVPLVSANTNPNAPTTRHTRGIASKSTDEGRRDTPRPCGMCSTYCHRCRAICPLCAATSRRVGIWCEDQRDRDSSLDLARDQ